MSSSASPKPMLLINPDDEDQMMNLWNSLVSEATARGFGRVFFGISKNIESRDCNFKVFGEITGSNLLEITGLMKTTGTFGTGEMRTLEHVLLDRPNSGGPGSTMKVHLGEVNRVTTSMGNVNINFSTDSKQLAAGIPNGAVTVKYHTTKNENRQSEATTCEIPPGNRLRRYVQLKFQIVYEYDCFTLTYQSWKKSFKCYAKLMSVSNPIVELTAL